MCQISSKSVENCDRESADTQTDTQTHRDDRGDLIICPMLCYSNGTDNKLNSGHFLNCIILCKMTTHYLLVIMTIIVVTHVFVVVNSIRYSGTYSESWG